MAARSGDPPKAYTFADRVHHRAPGLLLCHSCLRISPDPSAGDGRIKPRLSTNAIAPLSQLDPMREVEASRDGTRIRPGCEGYIRVVAGGFGGGVQHQAAAFGSKKSWQSRNHRHYCDWERKEAVAAMVGSMVSYVVSLAVTLRANQRNHQHYYDWERKEATAATVGSMVSNVDNHHGHREEEEQDDDSNKLMDKLSKFILALVAGVSMPAGARSTAMRFNRAAAIFLLASFATSLACVACTHLRR
uniref:Uncharacterized protein n=1 Tax=Oryza barthii TaxID=65489 RepID=A0A0D3G2Y3_9ORYZ